MRVIAFARVSLFGRGATRLHDTLLSIAASWLENRGEGHLLTRREPVGLVYLWPATKLR